MRIYDVLNPYDLLCEAEMLEETLSTDFKIGFELEGVCTQEEIGGDFLPPYHSSRPPEGIYKVLLDDLNNALGFGEGKIERDGSLRPSDDKGGNTFEYGSPIIPFNPTNINKIYKFLQKLPEFGVYTNDTCGFHTHMSFEGIDKTNVGWIMCCIAIDEKLTEELTELKGKGKVIPFTSGYATKDMMKKVKDALLNKDYIDVNNVLNPREKYEFMRVHPAGTMEWRGPRNFLNDADLELIHEYILKTYRVILQFTKIMHAQTWSGSGITLDRKTIEQKVKIGGDFKSPEEMRKIEKGKSFQNKVDNDPRFLLKLGPAMLDKVLDVTPRLLPNLLRSWGPWLAMRTEWNDKQLKVIIRHLSNHYRLRNDYDFRSFLEAIITDREKLYTLLSNDFRNEYVQLILSDFLYGKNITHQMAQMIDITSPENVKRLNDVLLEQTPKDMAKYIERLQHYGIDVSLEAFKKVLNSRYFYMLGDLRELPLKVQRMMLRKSPYMIQYIQNPDVELVTNLLIKHPEMKDYIAGVRI